MALVTGASRGIGQAVAIRLGAWGARCALLARTMGGLEETDDAIQAAGGPASLLLPLDLAAPSSALSPAHPPAGEPALLEKLGPALLQRLGGLDILVHAAGVLPKLTPVAHIQPADWQQALAVNLSASWGLIRACDPLLRAAPDGRAVFLTDSVAQAPRAYWGLYGAGKAGMEHLVRSWAAEVAQTPLRVLLHDPGPTRTRLRRAAFPGDDPAGPATPAVVAEAIAALCLPSGQAMPPASPVPSRESLP